MANTIRTDLILAAQTQGFQKAAQETERLTTGAARANEAQAKGYQAAQADAQKVGEAVGKALEDQGTGVAAAQQSVEEYQAELARLEAHLKKLQGIQHTTVRAMLETEKGTEKWKELQGSLRDTGDYIKLTENAIRSMNAQVLGDDGAVEAADKLIEGFQKAKISQRQYRRETEALKRELQSLAQEQEAVSRAMQETEKGTAQYKALGDRMRDVGERTRTTEGRLRAVERSTGKGMPVTEADMAKGAFIQGLVQGALPGVGPIQRGPGMQAQIAGTAIGRGARGVVQGAFGGVQGMQQMLAAAPIPGSGVLAAQFGQGMAFAGGGLQQQQARLRGLPLLGGAPEVTGRVRAARLAARREALGRSPEMDPAQIQREAQQARAQEIERIRASAPTLTKADKAVARARVFEYTQGMMEARDRRLQQERDTRAGEIAAEAAGGGAPTETQRRAAGLIARREQEQAEVAQRPIAEGKIRALAEREVGAGMDAELEKRIQAAGDQAAEAMRGTLEAPRKERLARERAAERRERRRMFAPIRQAGTELGAMNEQQAIQFAQQVAQRGGGGLQEMQQQGMLRTAVAAQTAFGIGTDVSGAFLQAGRRGGIVGAEGRGGEAMVDAMRGAFSMGLKDSEMIEHMQTMAGDMATFKQTGMPINPKSISTMGQEFGKTGIGALRGAVMGRQMAQGVQRISREGIQGGVDLMAAQVFGGFKGGGMGDFWESRKRMEALTAEGGEGITPEMMKEFVQKGTAGLEGPAGFATLQESLRRMGVQAGAAETEALAKSVTAPETMTEEQRTRAAKVREEMQAGMKAAPKSAADVQAQAADMIKEFGPAIRKAAQLTNQQNDVGAKLVPTFQALQASTTNINDIFSTMGAGPLKAFSEAAEGLSKSMLNLQKQFNAAERGEGIGLLAKVVTLF